MNHYIFIILLNKIASTIEKKTFNDIKLSPFQVLIYCFVYNEKHACCTILIQKAIYTRKRSIFKKRNEHEPNCFLMKKPKHHTIQSPK